MYKLIKKCIFLRLVGILLHRAPIHYRGQKQIFLIFDDIKLKSHTIDQD